MAGRRGGAPGGVMRTYARLRPLRRVEAQTWFSPTDRKHLFSSSSSSSSLLDSTCDPSSEDPDFIPIKRTGVSFCREINLRPERRTFSKRKKKSLGPPRRSRRKISATSEEEKENDERLLPPSDVVLSTPFRKFVTVRRKAAGPGVTMKPPSSKPRREADFGVGDANSSSLLFSSSLLTTSFMNSSAVMNLNLSSESISGRDPQRDHQRWARLRAALTLHRRKKVEAGSPTVCPAERRTRGKMSLSAHNSSMLLLSPFGSSLCTPELTDAEKVFAECQQEGPVPFHQCLTPDQLRRCQKVGEGVYGEVFRTLRGGQHVALKVIPIEGPQKVNGENQKSFAEILPEIIISKELSLLSEGEENRADGFIQLHSAHCVQGSYPPELLSAWDQFGKEKGTENERPDLFGPQQLFMILEFEFGGEDLERVSSRLPSVAASRSILHQVTAALAVAEEELRFEHRDLHWGNLLIEKSPSSSLSVSVGGERFDIPNAGVQVKIIDYTLSRLDKDGLTVFCDLSTDEDLFLGEGDLQFDVYRKMRQENRNAWSSYTPRSNVLWLHYLSDKLLTEVKYIKKPTSASHRRDLRRLQDFRREVQQFGSATEVLKRSRLFK